MANIKEELDDGKENQSTSSNSGNAMDENALNEPDHLVLINNISNSIIQWFRENGQHLRLVEWGVIRTLESHPAHPLPHQDTAVSQPNNISHSDIQWFRGNGIHMGEWGVIRTLESHPAHPVSHQDRTGYLDRTGYYIIIMDTREFHGGHFDN